MTLCKQCAEEAARIAEQVGQHQNQHGIASALRAAAGDRVSVPRELLESCRKIIRFETYGDAESSDVLCEIDTLLSAAGAKNDGAAQAMPDSDKGFDSPEPASAPSPVPEPVTKEEWRALALSLKTVVEAGIVNADLRRKLNLDTPSPAPASGYSGCRHGWNWSRYGTCAMCERENALKSDAPAVPEGMPERPLTGLHCGREVVFLSDYDALRQWATAQHAARVAAEREILDLRKALEVCGKYNVKHDRRAIEAERDLAIAQKCNEAQAAYRQQAERALEEMRQVTMRLMDALISHPSPDLYDAVEATRAALAAKGGALSRESGKE